MNEKNTIPIIVGVTGHRALREEDIPSIEKAVRKQLRKIQKLCPHSPVKMLSSLAEGGDLLCADVAERLGIPLIAALPCEKEQFVQDFTEEGNVKLNYHLQRAEQVFVTPAAEVEPQEGDLRSFAFRQAGIYVATHCHVLLALWDGGEGTRAACGTAEAVDFALHGSFTPRSGLCLRTDKNEAVIHVFTPRGKHLEKPAGKTRILGNWKSVLNVLRRTDDYNENVEKMPASSGTRLPEDAGEDQTLKQLDAASRMAGRLSRQNAQHYRQVLALLATASSLLMFAFLLYDEAQAIWMILVVGAMLGGAWACQRYAVHSDCHRRYLEYRALSECLRVQTYLRYAGSRVEAASLLSWTQQEETGWILDALSVLSIGQEPEMQHSIRDCWVKEQRDYHHNAAQRSGQQLSVSERIVNVALVISISLYVAAVGYELLCGGLIFVPSVHVADVELWRTVLKLILGMISTLTLFIANYYGKQSLPRSLSDHEKMERFFSTMLLNLEYYGQTEELLTVLAREELIENGNWISYQRDNTPDFSV